MLDFLLYISGRMGAGAGVTEVVGGLGLFKVLAGLCLLNGAVSWVAERAEAGTGREPERGGTMRGAGGEGFVARDGVLVYGVEVAEDGSGIAEGWVASEFVEVYNDVSRSGGSNGSCEREPERGGC